MSHATKENASLAGTLAGRISLLVSDVDGVWTDGRIIYSGDSREIKEFNVRDGLAVKLAQKAGIVVAVVTSRKSKALERRCRELGITEISQGAGNKLDELHRITQHLKVSLEATCYVGDDLPDLAPMKAAALSAAPSDAAPEVIALATWKLQSRGGEGAIRELIERLLRERGDWQRIVSEYDGGRLEISAG